MNKLNELIARCKYSVEVSANDHRDYYQSVETALEEFDICMQGVALEPEVRAKMIETDTIIAVQFYPETANSFYIVLHYDLDLALDEALECLGTNDGKET